MLGKFKGIWKELQGNSRNLGSFKDFEGILEEAEGILKEFDGIWRNLKDFQGFRMILKDVKEF